jgi:hypothetical protein
LAFHFTTSHYLSASSHSLFAVSVASSRFLFSIFNCLSAVSVGTSHCPSAVSLFPYMLLLTWGCTLTFGFNDIVLLKDTMNAVGYVKVLEDNLIPILQEYFQHRPCIFQQDNAAVHTANEVDNFFKARKLQVLDWPSRSPDLNIIKHVWHHLKETMKGLPVASTKEELWSNVMSAIVHIWSPEMTQKINVLYESLSNRMQAVIAAHGGNTSY